MSAMRWILLLCLVGCATSGVAGRSVASSPPPSPRSPLVATSAGFQITEAELEAYLQAHPKLARQLYDVRHAALDELTLDRLVDDQAAKAGVPSEAWIRAEVERRVVAPSEQELKTFFETRVAAEHPEARAQDLMPRIKEHLLNERRQEALRLVLDDLKAKARLELLLPPPRVKIAASGPSRGPRDAPVTIVEFSDYQCPYCQRQEEALKQIVARYPAQVRLVVMDFPLDMHADARRSAKAAACADQQGRFWEMHDRLFANQGALDEDELKTDASQLGLDGPRFAACLHSPEAEQRVAQSQREGEEAGVDGTPALFLNGRPFSSGAVSFGELQATVEEELKAVAKRP
jgi:protein-disulfide isomerase